MSIETKFEVVGGDLFLDSHGRGMVKGPLLLIPFDNVASLADGVAVTSIQARLHVNGAHRLRGVSVSATGGTIVAGGTDPAVDVYRHLPPPTAAPVAALAATPAAGNVNAGVHLYAVAFYDGTGSSTPGPTVSVTVSNASVNGQVEISDVPLGPTGTVGRKILRTKAGATAFFVQQTIANNTATTAVVDNTADSGISVTAEVANASGLTVLTGTIKLSNALVTAQFDKPIVGTLAAGVATDVYPATMYSLRVVTGATTGAVANVKGYLLVELIPS